MVFVHISVPCELYEVMLSSRAVRGPLIRSTQKLFSVTMVPGTLSVLEVFSFASEKDPAVRDEEVRSYIQLPELF